MRVENCADLYAGQFGSAAMVFMHCLMGFLFWSQVHDSHSSPEAVDVGNRFYYGERGGRAQVEQKWKRNLYKDDSEAGEEPAFLHLKPKLQNMWFQNKARISRRPPEAEAVESRAFRGEYLPAGLGGRSPSEEALARAGLLAQGIPGEEEGVGEAMAEDEAAADDAGFRESQPADDSEENVVKDRLRRLGTSFGSGKLCNDTAVPSKSPGTGVKGPNQQPARGDSTNAQKHGKGKAGDFDYRDDDGGADDDAEDYDDDDDDDDEDGEEDDDENEDEDEAGGKMEGKKRVNGMEVNLLKGNGEKRVGGQDPEKHIERMEAQTLNEGEDMSGNSQPDRKVKPHVVATNVSPSRRHKLFTSPERVAGILKTNIAILAVWLVGICVAVCLLTCGCFCLYVACLDKKQPDSCASAECCPVPGLAEMRSERPGRVPTRINSSWNRKQNY